MQMVNWMAFVRRLATDAKAARDECPVIAVVY